jgi:SAM-dependent methyltransferase
MSQPIPWTKEKIQEFLETEKPEYQKIELPFRLSTSGEDRKLTRDKIFANDISGKTVLEIGCCLGYFCLEALKRGARRTTGWEIDADRVRQARVIAEILGSSAEYQERDIETETPKEVFDVVICLNVLHHMGDPLRALDKLIALTGETLILEVASLTGLTRRERKKMDLPRWKIWLMSALPIAFFGWRNEGRNCYFTPAAMLHLLERQRHHFARVEVQDSEFKGRFIVIAQRRRVERLVVVAGPTSAGKSTFIREMLAGRRPELAAKLGVENFQEWTTTDARSLHRLTEPVLKRLLFHYDFLRHYGINKVMYDADPALHVIPAAQDVTLVTLWTPPPRLEKQLMKAKLARSRPRNFQQRKLHVYRRSAQVVRLYRHWFEFCDKYISRARKHIIVEIDQGAKFYSRDEWENLARMYE